MIKVIRCKALTINEVFIWKILENFIWKILLLFFWMNYYIAVRKYTVCGMNGINKNTQLDKGRENKIDCYKKWDLF